MAGTPGDGRGETLRTGRLVLRPVSMSDHAALLAHWNGPLVRRHLFDGRGVSPEQVTEIIAASQRDFATEGYGLWTVRPAVRGMARGVDLDPGGADAVPLAGVSGLRRHLGPVGADVEIVYSVEPARWGQGLAAEAARAVLGYAFDVVGLRRITAEIDTGNPASARVAEHLGMRRCPDGPDGPDGTLLYAADRLRWRGSSRVADV
ncbi:GNAT family N-acetyltransferase [Actinomadura kijaniata]|uniref:RimJ/RimL family protein N-acetyltransferase n=1 Tax=Actinomadura namibiensis TaxID=182080 RepID=A0A7W3LVN9_ACTNM|nr:GNAT family protein [Actinomadura namibiensis]MBA8955186.1 RimJ/RimL family protein N-acetyltransferase [Actinomadura namibiensis]